MKKSKWIIIFVIIAIIVFFAKGSIFVPEDRIINPSNYEVSAINELTSCQLDCSFGDGLFHEECIGYNGCEDSPFLRNRIYCESDEDCIADLGCCTNACEDNECYDAKLCSVSNSIYSKAHSFSCQKNIQCLNTNKCINTYNTKCQNNKCRIMD